jgi:two-component system, OmpR family, response regulator RegX3
VAEALELAGRVRPDLVLLDVMLPDGSGYDVCRELRRESRVPIIILTARGEETDRIVGLELGADDYIVKPFSAREVAARIRAVLRRAGDAAAAQQDGPLVVGELRLEPGRRSATLAGEELELTRKEFELLELLMREAGSTSRGAAPDRADCRTRTGDILFMRETATPPGVSANLRRFDREDVSKIQRPRHRLGLATLQAVLGRFR